MGGLCLYISFTPSAPLWAEAKIATWPILPSSSSLPCLPFLAKRPPTPLLPHSPPQPPLVCPPSRPPNTPLMLLTRHKLFTTAGGPEVRPRRWAAGQTLDKSLAAALGVVCLSILESMKRGGGVERGEGSEGGQQMASELMTAIVPRGRSIWEPFEPWQLTVATRPEWLWTKLASEHNNKCQPVGGANSRRCFLRFVSLTWQQVNTFIVGVWVFLPLKNKLGKKYIV